MDKRFNKSAKNRELFRSQINDTSFGIRQPELNHPMAVVDR